MSFSLNSLSQATRLLSLPLLVLAVTFGCGGTDDPQQASGGSSGEGSTGGIGGSSSGAAGGTSGQGATAGTNGGGTNGTYQDSPQWAACLKSLRARCEREVECAPADSAWKYGTSDQVERCVTANRERSCFDTAQPNQSPESVAWFGCVEAAVASLDCAEVMFFDAQRVLSACGRYPTGTVPSGGVCVNSFQCQTENCDGEGSSSDCSTCVAPWKEGEPCASGRCGDGLRCVFEKCAKVNTEDEPCKINSCEAGLVCTAISESDVRCRPLARLGDACDPAHMNPCPSFPPPTERTSGVVCENDVCTWKSLDPFKLAPGEPCDDAAPFDLCGLDSRSSAPTELCDPKTKTCKTLVAGGEPCGGTADCDQGRGRALCFQGVCTLEGIQEHRCYE